MILHQSDDGCKRRCGRHNPPCAQPSSGDRCCSSFLQTRTRTRMLASLQALAVRAQARLNSSARETFQ